MVGEDRPAEGGLAALPRAGERDRRELPGELTKSRGQITLDHAWHYTLCLELIQDSIFDYPNAAAAGNAIDGLSGAAVSAPMYRDALPPEEWPLLRNNE
jgi:hypothetical protein